MKAVIDEEDASRFWSRVDRSGGPDACWPMVVRKRMYFRGEVRSLRNAAKAKLGHLSLQGHQAAYLLTYGLLPELIRHRCAHNGCCNPSHMRTGTQRENRLDEAARRRLGIPAGVLFTYEDEQ